MNIRAEDLQVFYKSMDQKLEAYLRGVQVKAVKEQNLDLEQVAKVEGVFLAGRQGGYRLIVNSLHTKDGRTISVRS